ncbi:MAG: hypothetical protein ACYTFQ_32125, partial [Planctomycetota bacterium]
KRAPEVFLNFIIFLLRKCNGKHYLAYRPFGDFLGTTHSKWFVAGQPTVLIRVLNRGKLENPPVQT